MTRSNLLAVALWLFCTVAAAAERSVTVNGYGSDQKRAIADGLIQAIRQVKGVSVDSAEMINSISARLSEVNNDQLQRELTTRFTQSGEVSLRSRGLVSRYEVHSLSQQADQSYMSEMTVYVSQYETPGLSTDNRRKLAVVPFRLGERYFYLLGDKTAASKVELELRNKLIDQFTQSRKVAVLDRDFDGEYHDEKALWNSVDSAVGEKAKLGNVLGVDYLVVGNLHRLNSQKHSETIQLTGETVSNFSANAQLDYKIIALATRQVKWSDSIRVKFSDQQVRNMLDRYGSSQAGITQYLANELAQKALSNIYPMRVVAVKGSTVVLNQGGKTLKKGDSLDIYWLGEEMFDPYTKESLGQIEEKIAQVKVVRVNAKTSYAKVVEGDAELIEKGSIARR